MQKRTGCFIDIARILPGLFTANYDTAELVCAEKELSDWVPERSKFSYTNL